MTPSQFMERNALYPVEKGTRFPRNGGPDTWTHIMFIFSNKTQAKIKRCDLDKIPFVRWSIRSVV